MKRHLCFVYIPKYKCLKNQSICLDDRYEFEFNPYENVLIVRKNKNYIDHLFGEGIYSLTAIVGGNGAGKTTAIRYIMDMVVSGRNKKMDDGVYVVEEQGKLQVYSTRKIGFKNNDDNDEKELKIEQVAGDFSIKTFFYSAHFSTPSAIDIITDNQWKGMYNGSDCYRLLNDFQNYSNIYTFGMQQTMQNHIVGYNSQNFYRIALLLTEQYEEIIEFGLQLPQYIIIAPNISGRYSIIEKIIEDDDVKISSINLPKNKELTKTDVLYTYAYYILLNMAIIEGKVNKDIINTLNEWVEMFNEKVLVDENFYALFEQLLCKHVSKDIVGYISSVLQELESLCDFDEKKGTFYVDLCNQEKRSRIKNLLDDSRKYLIFLTARFFDMYYAHSLASDDSTLLSSGEQEMLNLFSRIYVAVFPKKMSPADNVEIPHLLILDEAEIGYHPMWQKKYVKNLVHFLNFLSKENDTIQRDFFQVILTSHSPIILSDILKSCTNYLPLGDEKIPNEETFGANIFDLYRNSFFIRDGLIGEFAWKKIKEINKFLEDDKEDKPNDKGHKTNDNIKKKLDEAKKIIFSLGDDRIKEYLKDRLYRFDSQYVIDYDERKIKELKSNSYHEQD